ncbi:MAG: YdgA family protein [Neisseriales bacterium]|nr:MAG: YdgA family protein [Neisseriales bacterium]
MDNARKKKLPILKIKKQIRQPFFKKNARLLVAIIAIIFVLYGGATYWFGKKAEETFWHQYHLVKDSPFFEVKSYAYQRGLLRSYAQMELGIKPHALKPYKDLLPSHLRTLFQQTIRCSQTIQHGPILYESGLRFHFGQALATVRFKMSAQTQAALKHLFNKVEPIVIKHLIRFSQNGQLSIRIPAFSYNEILSGINIIWHGMHIAVDHKKDFSTYSATITLPHAALTIPNIGNIQIDQLRHLIQKENLPNDATLLKSELNIQQANTKWKLHITEHDQFNKWMPWLNYAKKIVDFIDLQHSAYPSAVSLKNFRYRLDTKTIHQFVDTRGILQFDQLVLDDKACGAMKLDVTASHLYAPALSKIWAALKETLTPFTEYDEIGTIYLAALKKHGSTLLLHEPKITLNTLTVKRKDGVTTITGYILIPKLPLQFNSTQLFKRLAIQVDIKMPRKTLEDLVVAQANHLFLMQTKNPSRAALIEVENLTRSLFGLQIQMLNARGFIEENNEQLITQIILKNGKLTLNHQKVALP